jgi:protein involved in polysaccharide export with SLBB domain
MKKFLSIYLSAIISTGVCSGIVSSCKAFPMSFFEQDVTQLPTQKLVEIPRVTLGGPIDPATYRIGVGDKFEVSIEGNAPTKSYPLVVLPEGVVHIPDGGIVSVKGQTLAESQQKIRNAVQKLFPESSINVILEDIRTFIVRLTGAVEQQGIRYANATWRVSDVLDQAGNFYRWANQRAIEIRHTDGTVDLFDYSEYRNTGNIAKNLFVQDGDIIFVPSGDFSQGFVFVRTLIGQSGQYLYYKNETVLDFIKRENIGNIYVDYEKIMVIRNQGNGIPDTLQLSLYSTDPQKPTSNNFTLKPLDIIICPAYESNVYVDGEVKNPGPVVWESHRLASHFVDMAGRLSDAADDIKLKITRSGTNQIVTGDVPVFLGDHIYVPKKKHIIFKEWFDVISPILSIILVGKAVGIY